MRNTNHTGYGYDEGIYHWTTILLGDMFVRHGYGIPTAQTLLEQVE
jgi:hypothetical protein|tara:strand:+ start:100 stop:237 length:138 start_codon:yes stop_codon:yes gene_type:complete